MGNSDSRTDPIEFRFLISTSCPLKASARVSRVHYHMASPACYLCHPGSPSIGYGSYCQDRCSGLPLCRKGSTTPFLHFEATSEFACAAACRFAQLPFGAFVRKLNASGYPLHLPQATWANHRTPTVGL
jgi:hypothetical protein